MKEMVGGCCVCSDERGWPENPLVYCDGQNCTVAVHQACYGIVTVPTGPWYCRKCESQERSARVRCELCPSRDGALKKTDNQGWAHVVCALYIPEVRFGNVTTMEPIILQLIPPERYAKTCYICQEIGKGSRATVGACMQCNRSGCKQQFHVTCAQGLGLLCEEAGNYLDNVKYCGYCQYHYSKLKKGGNVKTIPPYKPITHDSSDGTSSPEKDPENAPSASTPVTANIKGNSGQSGSTSALNSSSSSSSKQRKSNSNKLPSSSSSTTSNNMGGAASGSSSSINIASSSASSSTKNSSSSSGSSKDKDKHSKSLNKISSSSKNQDKESSSSSTSSSTRDKSKSSKSNKESMNADHGSANTSGLSTINPPPSSIGGAQSLNSKDNLNQKFTTHNFTESVVMNADPVFGANTDKMSNVTTTVVSTNQPSSSITSTRETKSSSSASSGGGGSAGKKRKADSSKGSSNSSSSGIGAGSTSDTLDISNHPLALRDIIIKDVSVTLTPLPMDKTQDIGGGDGGSIEKISSSKKPKTDISSTSPRNDINIQNTAPVLMSSQIAGGSLSIKQQAISQTNSSSANIQQVSGGNTSSSNSITNTSSQPHIKPPILKEVSEIRNRSSSPYNSSATNSTGGSGTPSLYVSVPLSNANVPGINLPSTNANDHILTQTSRSSPLVNHSHHQSSSSLSSQQSIIERQSPRILQNQLLHLTDHSSPNSSAHSSISLHHSSNMSPTLNQRNDPSPMDTSGLKITYEKQNLRVAQLQEEQLPARRSRSQSGDSSSKSSRSGKRRSTAGSSSATNTSTTASNSSQSTVSTSAALPTGSNTEGSESAISGAGPLPAPVPVAVAAAAAGSGGSKNTQSHKHSDSSNAGENSSSTSSLKNVSNKNNVTEPVPPAASTSNNSQNTKQMNKKMLRAQQSQQLQQQQQHHQPTPPPPPIPVSQQQQQQNAAANAQQPPSSTASITSTTSLIPSEENNPSNSTSSSNSRTPDSVNLSILTSSAVTTISSASGSSAKDTGGGLKFTYESQLGVGPIGNQSISPGPLPIDSITKESPPSSPGSEAGSARKRGRKSAESKDSMKMFFPNGVHATHMLGNHLNPASSVAQKMSDQLNSEMEAHSIYTQSTETGPSLVGVPLPGKAGLRNPNQTSGTHSLSSMLGGNTNSVTGNTPQSLEQLLERQWEQGSQFLMEQAQHFDIASLLSCLHQLRTENVRLEEHVNNLIARRDHLLAVNARLAIPLNPAMPPNTTLNNLHMNGPTSESVSSRLSRTNPHFNSQQQQPPQHQPQQQLPVENGIDFRHSSHPPSNNNPSALSHN